MDVSTPVAAVGIAGVVVPILVDMNGVWLLVPSQMRFHGVDGRKEWCEM